MTKLLMPNFAVILSQIPPSQKETGGAESDPHFHLHPCANSYHFSRSCEQCGILHWCIRWEFRWYLWGLVGLQWPVQRVMRSKGSYRVLFCSVGILWNSEGVGGEDGETGGLGVWKVNPKQNGVALMPVRWHLGHETISPHDRIRIWPGKIDRLLLYIWSQKITGDRIWIWPEKINRLLLYFGSQEITGGRLRIHNCVFAWVTTIEQILIMFQWFNLILD